jgi:hypothetical protein
MMFNLALISVFLFVAACQGQHEGHSPAANQVAPAAEIMAISMPTQPELACHKDVMYNITSTVDSCAYMLYHREPAGEGSCPVSNSGLSGFQ